MVRAKVFAENVQIAIQVKEKMAQKMAESIRSSLDRDPLAYSDAIARDAEHLNRLKCEISGLKDTLAMLNGIMDEQEEGEL